MNKLDLAARLAQQSRQSYGKAADRVDLLVYKMLKKLEQSPKKPTRPSASKDKP